MAEWDSEVHELRRIALAKLAERSDLGVDEQHRVSDVDRREALSRKDAVAFLEEVLVSRILLEVRLLE